MNNNGQHKSVFVYFVYFFWGEKKTQSSAHKRFKWFFLLFSILRVAGAVASEIRSDAEHWRKRICWAMDKKLSQAMNLQV